jgi:hypothetical protein
LGEARLVESARKGGSRGAEDLFPFYWEVPEQGFRWVDEPGDVNTIASRSLVLASATAAGTQWKRYNPLRCRSLFATFAQTPLTEDGILAFAKEYGLLGPSCAVRLPEPIVLKGDPLSGIPNFCDDHTFYRMGVGESFESWSSEIATMRRMHDLWIAVRDGNLPPLRRMLAQGSIKEAESKFQTHVNTPVGLFPWPDLSLSLSSAPYLKASPSLRLMAWRELQDTISNRLIEHVNCRLIYSADRGRPRLQFIPKNLLGALWLQFARAVDGGNEFRRCAYCQSWIEPSEHGRVTRRYCSGTCRRKAFEVRKRKETRPERRAAAAEEANERRSTRRKSREPTRS